MIHTIDKSLATTGINIKDGINITPLPKAVGR